MKSSHKIIGIAFALLILTSFIGVRGVSSSQESFVSGNGSVVFIKSGHRIQAPAISGMTLSGKTYIYSVGKVAVINVWASWCAPCRAEAPTLVALAKKYSEVVFIGILTRDNPASAEAFERRFAIPYPSLIDDAILIGFKGSLPANAIPTTVVIDKNGKVAARISGQVTFASLSKLIEQVSAE